MNAWKFFHLMFVLLAATCVFFQQALAFSLAKDFVIAQILYNILKPRFVPLPIPLPIPLKFVKHTHKPYPVPLYSHSLSAHQVGHSYDGNSGYNLAGANDYSTGISHYPLGHHDASSSSSEISLGHHDLSTSLSEYSDLIPSLSGVSGHHDLSTSLSQISGFHLPSYSKNSIDHDLLIALSKQSAKNHDLSDSLSNFSTHDHDLSSALSKLSTEDYKLSSTLSKLAANEELYKKVKSTPHNIQSIVKELESESEESLLHEDSNHVDSIHDDIEAIGGFDILTDLDSLGESKQWW